MTNDNKKITENIIESQQKNAFKIRLKKGAKLAEGDKNSLKDNLGCFYSNLHEKYVCDISKKELVSKYLSEREIGADLIDIHDNDITKSKKVRKELQKLDRLEEKYQKDWNSLTSKTNKYRKDSTPEDYLVEPTKEDKTETAFLLEQDFHEKACELQNLKEEIEELRKTVSRFEEEEKQKIKEGEIEINPADWPFIVLGLNYSMEALLSFNGKILKWPVERISEARIKAIFGQTGIGWQELRDSILYAAHDKGMVNDETPLKQGVRRIKNKWIVISGKNAGVFENGNFTELSYPTFDGKLIEFSDDDWLDWTTLKNNISNPLQGSLQYVFEEISNKVRSWNWLVASMAKYVTAFIFLNPFQQIMHWRPWLYLTGQKGTGKTSFFEYVLLAIYGALVCRLDKSTSHATAQTIGNTGLIATFDEFEKHKHIPDILELAKLFNKGGRKTSGTSAEKANTYQLNHLAWFGSIYLPRQLGQDAAQESRMVKFELKKLKNETPLLEKIDEAEGKKLAAKIISSMIQNWNRIEEGAQKINSDRRRVIEKTPGIEIRTVENFMYASSLLNLIDPENEYTVPSWSARQIEDDSDKIIGMILSSVIKIGMESDSIAEVLEKANGEQSGFFGKELEKVGLKLTNKDGNKYLALKCETVTRYLLKDTDYRELDIQAPLSRIEGVKISEQVKGLNRCVLVPMAHIVNIMQ